MTIQAIAKSTPEQWFEHPITVFPHHTDYGGIVWHGTYLAWLEEARVQALESTGVTFNDFVSLGCDTPVIDLSLRYHKPLKLGDKAIVKTLMDLQGVKLKWEYKIQSLDSQITYLTGSITLVSIDREKGKIMRKLPPLIQAALTNLSG